MGSSTGPFMLGSGVRYNFNSRYAISAGINLMHVSKHINKAYDCPDWWPPAAWHDWHRSVDNRRIKGEYTRGSRSSGM